VSDSFFNDKIINNVIKNYLNDSLKDYGDVIYAYAIMKKKNMAEYCVISNYPDEWVDIYKKNSYQYTDPVVIRALNSFLPFFWTEKIIISSSLQLIFLNNSILQEKALEVFSFAKKYNIISGCTFILHDCNNNLAILTLLINGQTGNTLKKKIEENKDKLQLLLLNTHDALISLYKEMNAAICKNSESKKEKFSPIENGVLYWSSMGKTYPEIAGILGIKLSTVKFHMGNIVKKLGVLNAKHAIRLGIELQLIKPITTC